MKKSIQGDLQIKELIIKKAGELFGKFGLSKTTLEDIAKEVGMAKSSLYYYFNSKEQIFSAVLEKETEIFKQRLLSAMQNILDPREKIKIYTLVRMQCMRDLLNMYSALREDYLKHYEFIQKMRESYDKQERELIESFLTEGNDKGIFDIKNISLTSYAIIIAIKGFEYEWAVKNLEKDAQEQIEQNIELLLNVLFMGIVKRQ
jgi:AcrR family transcriptional regulator